MLAVACDHDWQPQSTVALYRCARCLAFGIKRRARTGYGDNTITPVRCSRCDAPAVVLHVRNKLGIERRDPRCAHHRPAT